MKVGIVDYGMGNLLSVFHAFNMLGADPVLCKTPKELSAVDKIVLPGVGAFRRCMESLHASGFFESLEEEVIQKAKPFIGICLGMQVVSKKGIEGGETLGLGWFDGETIPITSDIQSLRVPHIGWNNLTFQKDCPLFKGIGNNPDVYFVHSYQLKPAKSQEQNVVASTEYGGSVTAAILKDNVFATQFHPEKSQKVGLRILSNFLTWNPR